MASLHRDGRATRPQLSELGTARPRHRIFQHGITGSTNTLPPEIESNPTPHTPIFRTVSKWTSDFCTEAIPTFTGSINVRCIQSDARDIRKREDSRRSGRHRRLDPDRNVKLRPRQQASLRKREAHQHGLESLGATGLLQRPHPATRAQ